MAFWVFVLIWTCIVFMWCPEPPQTSYTNTDGTIKSMLKLAFWFVVFVSVTVLSMLFT